MVVALKEKPNQKESNSSRLCSGVTISLLATWSSVFWWSSQNRGSHKQDIQQTKE